MASRIELGAAIVDVFRVRLLDVDRKLPKSDGEQKFPN